MADVAAAGSGGPSSAPAALAQAGDAAPERRPLHLRASVRVRITLAAVLVTTVAVGVAGWILLRTLEDTQIGQVEDDMEDQLARVVDRLEAGDDPQAAIDGPPVADFVTVYDEDGEVVAQPRGFMQESESAPADPPPPEGGEEGTGAIVGPDGEVIAAGPIETISRLVETSSGTLNVTASAPTGQLTQVARSVDALRSALLVGLPALVILVAGIAWVLVGRALRPVEAIRAEVDEITGSTMHRRVPEPPTGDEIGRLARTMNAMLGRLERASTRQRQFVSDASHELRSPVAAIRTGLEVARRKGDKANWRVVADTALAEEARLEALLDDLLLLASQDENGQAASRRTPVNLAAVALAEAERPRRVPVQVTPELDDVGGGALVVPGAVDQLARVVSNLLDNAARYATSEVQAGLVRQNRRVRLTVDDDGPGIPATDRERVFERFTRLDDGRARHDGGSGLGLAVVRSIVSRHHGRVWTEASPLGGARFVVSLPARSPGP